MSCDEECQIAVYTCPQMREARAFADDVGEATVWVGAESAPRVSLSVIRVSNSLIFSVPTEVPYMPNFTAPAGDASLSKMPDPCRKPRGGALPKGRKV